MLGHKLRHRGLRAVRAPAAFGGHPLWCIRDVTFTSAADGKQSDGPASEPGPSSTPHPNDQAKQEISTSKDGARVHGSAAVGAASEPAQPSPATAAAMAQLKTKLAAEGARGGAPSAHASTPYTRPTLHQQKSSSLASPQPLTTPDRAAPQPQGPPPRHAASFQGVSLQLGEAGNPLQGMAVLTHTSPRQLEEYASNPLAADQRFLANLQRMAAVPQQRAATIMQMAGGDVPPPAVLVWAAQEVVRRVQQLVRERLAGGVGGSSAPAAAVEAAAVAELGPEGWRFDPWYPGALQLARLAAAGQTQPAPPPSTETELLRAFTDPTTPLPPAATAASPAAPLPYIPRWEDLMTLSELPTLLAAAAAGSPTLASTLELTGLRSAPAAAAAAAAAAMEPWLLPQLRAAAAAARQKALEAAGIVDAPLEADSVLTALAMGTAAPQSGPAAAPAGDVRQAAAEWLAAATLLWHSEERLGCAGGALGVRQEVVAVLQLLGLPLEPRELPYMDELKVSEKQIKAWISALASQIATGALPGGATAVPAMPVPPDLNSRLQTVRQRLAAAGRALALLAPEPGQAGASTHSETAVQSTAAWLRAVGTPLVSGLLSGGYGSLNKLRSMVPELREALVLRLLEVGRVGGGAAALTAALYGDADAAWRSARVDGAAAAAAAALLQGEALAAELDLVHEKFVAPAPTLPPPRPLPSDDEVAAAVRALPPPVRQLYNSYYVLHPAGAAAADAAGAAGPRERQGVLEALAAVGEDGLRKAGEDLQGWLAEARKGLLVLPPPLLALLLRFVRVQVSVTPEAATAQRNKLTILATLVAEQQRRAVEVAAPPGGSSAEAAVEAAELAAAELAQGLQGRGGVGRGRLGLALSLMLGEKGAVDFASWMQALALNSRPSMSTQEMLAQQHMAMDVERYLAMTHDPRLHLPGSGISHPPTPSHPYPARPTTPSWTDPGLRSSESSWLDSMRLQLDLYLQALGHRPLGDAEWGVYRDAALVEWEAGRPEREARAAAAGQSGFFNPRADEVYLQQLLERNIAPGDPLGAQSRRYLDTLLRNPTWSFAQRKQAVERLIQLNDYFLRQPAPPAEGSPFAALFAVGGPDPVPRLGPLVQGHTTGGGAGAGNGKAVVGPRGRGESGAEKLTLPEGF